MSAFPNDRRELLIAARLVLTMCGNVADAAGERMTKPCDCRIWLRRCTSARCVR